jgi:hypothetical protein
MAESILQKDKTKCFLCKGNDHFEPLDCHHCLPGANRKLSEKYGLKVYLHHNTCHIFGENSVHGNAKVMKKLQAYAQKVAMAHYGWSVEDFIKIFGKNYL